MGKEVKKAKWLLDYHKSVYLLFCNAALSSKNSYNILIYCMKQMLEYCRNT